MYFYLWERRSIHQTTRCLRFAFIYSSYPSNDAWQSSYVFISSTQSTLLDSGALLFSAKPLPSAALGKEPPVKNPSAKNSLPSAFSRALGKVFAECPTLGKVGTEKKPEKMGKMEFFLIGGGPHRPAPAHLRIFRVNFAATWLMGFEPATSPTREPPLPLHHTVTCFFIPF